MGGADVLIKTIATYGSRNVNLLPILHLLYTLEWVYELLVIITLLILYLYDKMCL